MSPVILGRAGLRYALKIHGSDLSYSILPDLARFRSYAQEACDGAAGILVGSGHIAERLRLAVDDPETNAKVRLGPPGVDTTLFSPVAFAERRPTPPRRGVRLGRRTASARPPSQRPGTGTRQAPRPTRSSGSPKPKAPGPSSSAS